MTDNFTNPWAEGGEEYEQNALHDNVLSANTPPTKKKETDPLIKDALGRIKGLVDDVKGLKNLIFDFGGYDSDSLNKVLNGEGPNFIFGNTRGAWGYTKISVTYKKGTTFIDPITKNEPDRLLLVVLHEIIHIGDNSFNFRDGENNQNDPSLWVSGYSISEQLYTSPPEVVGKDRYDNAQEIAISFDRQAYGISNAKKYKKTGSIGNQVSIQIVGRLTTDKEVDKVNDYPIF